MATLGQLASQIRFQLEQLSERNAHHDFEHLCRWLARKRICANILPATGPVSALGDQGRDFETFRTYLHLSPIGDSSFVGLASEGPIAFACTLEKKIGPKIKQDVGTILESGTPVVDIHYFCATDVSTGQRHKLQAWAKKEKDVLLEIHDGQAISEYLTDQDLFWLAEQYLNIPADLYPRFPMGEEDQWYRGLLDYWKQPEHPPRNYAAFADIKAAIRHATFTEAAKRDLPFWIKQMEQLIDLAPFEELKRKATYEILVASLRGLGSLIGYESKVSAYFDRVSKLTTPSDLEDVTNLRNYCLGAYYQNQIQVGAVDLRKWSDAIITRIESELQNAAQPGTRCLLLQTRGLWYALPNLEEPGTTAVDQAIQSWLELARLADQAPLFPLERFADLLTELLRLPPIGSYLQAEPAFSTLTERIDELLAKRHGGFVAAEKCRDRAMVFYENGEIPRAIKEIHKAKIQWFAKETLTGSLLASIFLSTCYDKLGFVFAAKYYALATAYIGIQASDSRVQHLISQALNVVATCDYSIGAYFGFLDFTDVGLGARSVYSSSTNPTDPENEISRTIFHATALRTIAKRLSPDLLRLVDERIANWGELRELVEELIPTAENVWRDTDFNGIWSTLQEQMYGRPFSDVGQSRSVQFKALGVTWRFDWDNSYEITPLAEEIVAVVQILLTDIADLDWYLLRTTVEVEIALGDPKEIGIQEISSNEIGRWKLILSRSQIKGQSGEIGLVLASTLLHHASLLPTEQFQARIEAAFQAGLMHKLLFGQRYISLYGSFVNREMFDRSNRRNLSQPAPNRPFTPKAEEQLPWYGGRSPGYNEDESKHAVRTRYEKTIVPIGHTLERLRQDESFRKVVESLRADGWLDWHLLMAVASIVINYRANSEMNIGKDMERAGLRFNELMNEPEPESSFSIPLSEFSLENMRMVLRFSMVSTLGNLGLELHQHIPDLEAISDFLGERYNYWTDDVEHADYGL